MSCSVSFPFSRSLLLFLSPYSETLRPPFTLRVWSTLDSLSFPPSTRFLSLNVSVSTIHLSRSLRYFSRSLSRIYDSLLFSLFAPSHPFLSFIFHSLWQLYFNYSVAHMLSICSSDPTSSHDAGAEVWRFSPFYLSLFFAVRRDKQMPRYSIIDTVRWTIGKNKLFANGTIMYVFVSRAMI